MADRVNNISTEQFTYATRHYADKLYPLVLKKYGELVSEKAFGKNLPVLDLGSGDGQLDEMLLYNYGYDSTLQPLRIKMVDDDWDLLMSNRQITNKYKDNNELGYCNFNFYDNSELLRDMIIPKSVALFVNVSGYFSPEEIYEIMKDLPCNYMIANFFVAEDNLNSDVTQNGFVKSVESSRDDTTQFEFDLGWENSTLKLDAMSENGFNHLLNMASIVLGFNTNYQKYYDFKYERMVVFYRY